MTVLFASLRNLEVTRFGPSPAGRHGRTLPSGTEGRTTEKISSHK
jgi:hypothetical protein